MGNKQKKPDRMDVAIELKMTVRTMERQSQKLEQEERAERKKILDVRYSFTWETLDHCWVVLFHLPKVEAKDAQQVQKAEHISQP